MSIAPLLNINEFEAEYEYYFIEATQQLNQLKSILKTSFSEFNDRRLNYLHPNYFTIGMDDDQIEFRSFDLYQLQNTLINQFNEYINHCESWRFIFSLDFFNDHHLNILKTVLVNYDPSYFIYFL